MKHINLFITLVLSLFAWDGMAQDTIPTYNQFYNLDFTPPGQAPQDLWTITDGDFTSCGVNFFKIPYSDRPASLRIVKRPRGKDPFHFSIYHSILLPHRPKQSIQVSFNPVVLNSSDHIDSVSLLVRRLDSKAKVFAIDTVTTRLRELDGFSYSKPLFVFETRDDKTEILQLSFHFEAKNDSLGNKSNIIFLPCSIKVDSVDIGTLPVRELTPPDLREMKVTKLNLKTGKGLSKIRPLNEKRLIGLGESAHFHYGFDNIQKKVISYLAEKRKGRLVLLEMPMELSLTMNRMINDPSYKADTSTWRPDLLDMLRHLRHLNERVDGKIQCFGFDYENRSSDGVQSTETRILDFLMGLKEWGHNQMFDELAILLSKSENEEQIISFIDDNRDSLNKFLWLEEIDLIKHSLSVSSSVGKNERTRFYLRDSVMAQNVSYLVNRFSPDKTRPVVMLSHLFHLGITDMFPNMPTPSLGYMLHEEFKDDYTCIGMLAKGGWPVKDLTEPREIIPENCVENQMAVNRPICYYAEPTVALDGLSKIKATGRNPLSKSYPIVNLYDMADGGLIFLNAENEVKEKTWAELHPSKEEMSDYLIMASIRRMRFIIEAKANMAHYMNPSDNK